MKTSSRFKVRKEEAILFCSTSLASILLFILKISINDNCAVIEDVILASIGLLLGIFGAVSTSIYLRYSQYKKFIDNYKIVGTYDKFDTKGKLEKHGNGNKEAIIEHVDGLIFKMSSQYVHADGKVHLAESKISFNEDLSGFGKGSYKYNDIEDSGIYEVIAHANQNDVTISVKYQNLYPNVSEVGSYLIKKKSEVVDKDKFN